MTVPGSDRVGYHNGRTYIEGYEVTKMSEYLGWEIYRTVESGPTINMFIAVNVTAKSGLVSIKAKNLDGIKRRIRTEEGFA